MGINNPSKNFMVSINIIPRDKISGTYSNIYCFKDDPTSGIVNVQPDLDFRASTYNINSWMMDSKDGYKDAISQNSLTENVECIVATKVLGDYMTLYVDGTVVATTKTFYYADRADLNKLYAFVSNNGDPPANVVVKGLRFINL